MYSLLEKVNDNFETARRVNISAIKRDIMHKYSILADAYISDSLLSDVTANIDTFRPIMSYNVAMWALSIYNEGQEVVRVGNLAKMMASYESLTTVLKELAKKCGIEPLYYCSLSGVKSGLDIYGVDGVDSDDITDEDLMDAAAQFNEVGGEPDLVDTANENETDIELDDINLEDIAEEAGDELIESIYATEEEAAVAQEVQNIAESDDYIPKLHDIYYSQFKRIVMGVWEDLYSKRAYGQETVSGIIVPGGAIKEEGAHEAHSGILRAESGVHVDSSSIANAVFEEYIGACKDCGIEAVKEVSSSYDEIRKYKYNPLMHKRILCGDINKEAYRDGWPAYSKALVSYMDKMIRRLAVEKFNTGSDKAAYEALSPYLICLESIDSREDTGMLLRISCANTSKTGQVANRLAERLRQRELTDKSVAQGRLFVGRPEISASKYSATIQLFSDVQGYQSIPSFTGEMLVNIDGASFNPSMNRLMIGVDLQNNIMYAPFDNWLLPIVAGSRSGKGVLTLDILINIIGMGSPLFYLDGKPDMAVLLWELQKKYHIPNMMVTDCTQLKDATGEITGKPVKVPFEANINKMMARPKAIDVLKDGLPVMTYLKMMMIVLLSSLYYKSNIGMDKYGDMFVVFDEMMNFSNNVKNLIQATVLEMKSADRKDIDKINDCKKIRAWVENTLVAYASQDKAAFGAGIKAVALTQSAVGADYADGPGKEFVEQILLRRNVKLFGRQQSSGPKGVNLSSSSEQKKELYDQYYYFGVGYGEGNTYDTLKTFKPLLVLNENDSSEYIGTQKDGPFTSKMVERVEKYATAKTMEDFRNKYFNKNSKYSGPVGFEGAIAEVARLQGRNFSDVLQTSFGRAYEIADQALRYFGVIGQDGIDSVYDYICSCEPEHLWTFDTIRRKLAPSDTAQTRFVSSVFSASETEDEVVDFGEEIDGVSAAEIVNDKSNGTHASEFFEGANARQRQMNLQEKELFKEQRYDNFGSIDEGLVNGGYKDKSEMYGQPYIDYEEQPASSAIDGRGRRYEVSPTKYTTVEIPKVEQIHIDMPSGHPAEKFEGLLGRCRFGSRYELKARWKAIIDGIKDKVNTDLVTRFGVTRTSVIVNNKTVSMVGLVGGFSDIRLEDIAEIDDVFKTFKNVKEFYMDSCIFEAMAYKYDGFPNCLFDMGRQLIKITLIRDDGIAVTVGRDGQIGNDARLTGVETNKAKIRSQIDTLSYTGGNRTRHTVGKTDKAWKSCKSFSSKGWQRIQANLTAERPKIISSAFIGAASLVAIAIGGAVFGIGRVMSIFKN